MIKSIILFYKRVFRVSLFGLLLLSLISACLDKVPEPLKEGTPLDAVLKLNKNVDGLRNLAFAYSSADSIALFSIKYYEDGSVGYLLGMKEGRSVELYSEIVSDMVCVPELSMEQSEGVFFWTVNGVPVSDSDGNKVAVTDLTKPISFLFLDESICCKVKNSIVGEFPFTKADYQAKDVKIDYDVDSMAFVIHLSSGYETTLPAISDFHLLDTNVPNRSFYKDVFLDAGIALTSRKTLAAAESLGFSVEGICFDSWDPDSKESAKQRAIVSGNSIDHNGRLLYPDGQPRYKLLFVNGGLSTDHGKSLGESGLESMRVFVKNGGSYVGTCAGAFLASNGYNGKIDYPYYLSVWPGMMRQSGLKDAYTGMFIEKVSPLLQYGDLGGDHYVDSVRHNTGGYPVKFPLRTEILARYDYPQKSSIHRQPSIWAYKKNAHSGRVVMTGSHPEVATAGERRDLTAAMMLYAMDGVGVASLKGFLKNGEKRSMDKETEDMDPAFTRIGDRQTHHFATYIPADAKNIRVELDSPSGCDFALMMNHDSFAFADSTQFRSSMSGSRQQLSFLTLPEGVWFIAVQCLATVTVKETDYGQEYTGKTEVLNGIPYHVLIRWE